MAKKLPLFVFELSKKDQALVEKTLRKDLAAEKNLTPQEREDAVYDGLNSKVQDLPNSIVRKLKSSRD